MISNNLSAQQPARRQAELFLPSHAPFLTMTLAEFWLTFKPAITGLNHDGLNAAGLFLS